MAASRPSATTWSRVVPARRRVASTSALRSETNVYAPVDGTILAINPVVISGRRFGHRVDIQPATTPSLVVTVTNIKVAATLEVGHRLTASRSRLGRTIDISGVQTAALAQFTQDKGHHVHMEVVPAANVALP